MTLEDFLNQLFGALGRAGIAYCILRNHEELPYRNTAADIDLLVAADDLEDALSHVGEVEGVCITGRVPRSQATHVFVSGVCWADNTALEIDFMTSLGWKGLPFIDTAMVLDRSRPADSHRSAIRIPHPAAEAVVSLLSSLLIGGWIKGRYQADVRSRFDSEADGVGEILTRAFGPALAVVLMDLITAGDETGAIALVPRLRRQLAWRCITANPLVSARAVVRYYLREIRIRWTSRYVDDVFIIGGDTGERSRLGHELARRARHMGKHVRVRGQAGEATPSRLRWRLNQAVPRILNRTVHIWIASPYHRTGDDAAPKERRRVHLLGLLRPRRGLVLAIGPPPPGGIPWEWRRVDQWIGVTAASSAGEEVEQSIAALRAYMNERVDG